MTTKSMNIPTPDPELNPELHAMVREMGGRVLLQAPGIVGFTLQENAGRFLLQVKGDRVFIGESGSAEKMVDVAALSDIHAKVGT